MPDERPVGSLERLECLAEDPFGVLHRGLEWVETRKTREVLIRQYHPAWLDLGLATRQHEILRNLVHLGHLKPYKGCHASRQGIPELVWPFTSGRSLAQVLQRADALSLPFGVDQALFLVWALSHHLRHLHQVKLPSGFLAPHRIWIGFDGWVQLLDVPVMGLLQELLPAVPRAQEQVAAYLRGPVTEGLDRDCFQLGALLYEMLTHKPLGHASSALKEARLAGPGNEPIPGPILDLLNRLLGLSSPFQTLEELEFTMETSLFEGDFDPTTFGLAFTMQSFFRQELADAGMSQDYESSEPAQIAAPNSKPRRSKLPAILAAAFLLGGIGVWSGLHFVPRSQPSTPALHRVPPPAQVIAPPPATPAPTPKTEEPPMPLSPAVLPPKLIPVKLRVFIDEEGRVRQAHVVSGAAAGSGREQAACEAAMRKRLPSQAGRTWDEVTVMVP